MMKKIPRPLETLELQFATALASERESRVRTGDRKIGLSNTLARVGTATLAALALTVGLPTASGAAEERSWRCARPPVERCVERHGRLSSQNGIALKLWLVGTNRVLSIENDFQTDMPPIVSIYLEITSPEHSYIYGDFQVCPLGAEQPGRMRSACIGGATRLVVQNLRSARPPFKLVSTWPSTKQD